MSPRQLVKSIPHARMVFPSSTGDRLKYVFWRFYTPLHPLVRDTSLAMGLVKHSGRQPFLLGHVAPQYTVEDVALHLVREHGFGNHFIAWNDEGEVVSLRRVVGFRHQYHVRIFSDGEVRAHFEFTPEYRPIQHLQAKHFEERRADFVKFLGEKIIFSDRADQPRRLSFKASLGH